jgi:hypothetical protein
MELLGNVSHLESRFSLFGDGVSVGAREVHGLRQMYHRLKNHFGHTRWNFSVTWVLWNLVLVHLETVLVSVQDMRVVCANVLQQQHSLLSQASWGRLEMKPKRDEKHGDT